MINTYPIYLRIARWCFRNMLRQSPYAVCAVLSVNRAMYQEIGARYTEDNVPTKLSVLQDGVDYFDTAVRNGRGV